MPPPELAEAAYFGFAGEFVRAVAPYTEASDSCIMAHFLPAVGILAGPKVHVWAGNKQAARINVVVVGPTNSGRKGTGFGPVERLMEIGAGDFWRSQHVGGLSSGEGLIQKVSDIRVTSEDGSVEYVPVEKRLLVVEQELSRVLANIKREGNILSQIIREAFDSGNLATLTVNPRHAFGAHVCIVGHITPEELVERLDHVDMANGFGNRFMWFLVRSEKMLPFTDPIPDRAIRKFTPRLEELVDFGASGEGDASVTTSRALPVRPLLSSLLSPRHLLSLYQKECELGIYRSSYLSFPKPLCRVARHFQCHSPCLRAKLSP